MVSIKEQCKKYGMIVTMPNKFNKAQHRKPKDDHHKKAGKLIVRKADGTVEEKPAMTRAQVEKILYGK